MTAANSSHAPVRMCVACSSRFPKAKLTRFVCPGPGASAPVEDPAKTLPGRGLYLCSDPACRKRFASSRGWRRKCKGDANG